MHYTDALSSKRLPCFGGTGILPVTFGQARCLSRQYMSEIVAYLMAHWH